METEKYERLSVEELKKIQLGILEYVADYCEKNNIRYWLDFGTLIGAIRHKGYIPWDDDIDLGMLREDYDKFISEFNINNDSKYEVHCIENDPGYFVPYAKVYDTTTILFEPDEKGHKLCVNIDIFPHDNAPDDDEEVKRMYDIRDRLREKYLIIDYKDKFTGNMIKRSAKHLRRFLYSIIYKNSINIIADNSKRYKDTMTKRVGNFTGYSRIACNRQIFDSFTDVEFEMKKYKAPIGYDEWLRSIYGDYMELPPPEKQITHHRNISFKRKQEK